MFHYGEDHLTCRLAVAIAKGDTPASISATAQARVVAAHEAVLRAAAGEEAVYGINTGFGPLCSTIISAENTALLQRNLLLSHSVGVGELLDPLTVRLLLVLKVHALARGFSGIAPEVLERIQFFLANDIIPCVPSQGSVGASGDLAPLSHLFLPLIGEGEVSYNGNIAESQSVLAEFNVQPLTLGPKAGLALINGTQYIAAHAVQAVARLQHCLAQADIIAALMIEGLLGSSAPFRSGLHQLRAYPGCKHVAQRMAFLLRDSAINSSHLDCGRVQDPYSLRCVPQVHGASRQAWLHLKEAVEIEINSVTDNPIVLSPEDIVSGGNFHGQPLALPLDYAALAAAELGNISDRRAYLSLEGTVPGTPKLLLEDTGVNSGLMIVQYTSAALVSENKSLCFPASADSIPTSLGQEDHVSMGSISSRKTLRIIDNLEKILGIELLCAAQAMEFRRPLRSSAALEAVHALVREHIAVATQDRYFGKDIAKAVELIKTGQVQAICAPHWPSTVLDKRFDGY
ncbi:MAG: histidine ammonia-lyase [Bacteroidota bacterium]